MVHRVGASDHDFDAGGVCGRVSAARWDDATAQEALSAFPTDGKTSGSVSEQDELRMMFAVAAVLRIEALLKLFCTSL